MNVNASRSNTLSTSQNMMIFVLSMSLFGLSDLVTELIPEPQFGPLELNIPYFSFIALTLSFLFNPLYAALGAAIGETVFGDLLMGDFGGLSELEGCLQLFIGVYIAGLMVRNVKHTSMLVIACLVGVGIEQLLSFATDVAKVAIGVEQFEAVDGLPQSVLILEGIEFIYEYIVAGLIVGIIPVLFLVPRLHGKIEPLLGLKPRSADNAPLQGSLLRVKWIGLVLVCGLAAALIAFVTGMDFNPGEWEAELTEQFGDGYVWILIGIAASIALIVLATGRILAGNRKTSDTNKAV